jgi:hypothetical protein
MTRTVTVPYETESGEQEIAVEVSRDGHYAVIDTDLSDVPEGEQAFVAERAVAAYWAAERAAYVASQRDIGCDGQVDCP